MINIGPGLNGMQNESAETILHVVDKPFSAHRHPYLAELFPGMT